MSCPKSTRGNTTATHPTITAENTTATIEVAQLHPDSLDIGENVRDSVDLAQTPDFVESIREKGRSFGAPPQQQSVGEGGPLGSIGVALTKLFDDFVEGGGEFVREILAETFS